MDNEKLIKEVFARRPLWEAPCKGSNKREHSKRLWLEVANALNSDSTSVKKRWKSLKDNYRVELRKFEHSLKHGHGKYKNKYTIKWTHFNSLNFLRDLIMISTESEEDSVEQNFIISEIDDSQNLAYSEADYDDNEDAGDIICKIEVNEEQLLPFEITQQPNEQRKRKYSRDEVENNSNAEIVDEIPDTRTKKLKLHIDQNGVKETKKTTPNILENNREDVRNDADYNFLLSLLPYMKNLSNLGKLKFRTETSRVMLEITENDMQQLKSKPQKKRNFNLLDTAHSSYDED